MIKNANIRATLEDMLDVLDMRGTVNIYTGETTSIKYAEGKEGRARVESILAGGYNIQRLHVRVLVKEYA